MPRLALAVLALIYLVAPARAQNFSAHDLASRTIEWRGVEAVIWGMPAASAPRPIRSMQPSSLT
jgi:hypothetical protein